MWNNASCLSLIRGPYSEEDDIFKKSTVLHNYLFGIELPDTVVLLTEAGSCFILSTKKKCEFLEPAVGNTPAGSTIVGLTVLKANKGGNNNAENFDKLMELADINSANGEKMIVGHFPKESTLDSENGGGKVSLVYAWEKSLQDSRKTEFVDAEKGMSLVMSIKEEVEIEIMRKSSILANKVLKRGFIPRIEEIIDSELKVTHEELAGELDGMIEDPSKIDLKNVPKNLVQSCYYPIVQSGGEYNIKISAQSTNKTLKYDIILVSFGARYQDYCSNIGRTFLVDPPKFVSETYETLLGTQNACLEAMVPGKPLKAVYAAAVKYLRSSGNESLVQHLPKNMGFAMGLDFRDPNFVLTSKNQVLFKEGMIFTLSVGFNNVPLSTKNKAASHDKSAVSGYPPLQLCYLFIRFRFLMYLVNLSLFLVIQIKSLDTFALLVSDMVSVTSSTAEIFTKHSKALTEVSYTINDEEEDDDDNEEDTKKGGRSDEAIARALSKANDNFIDGQRRSGRLASTTTSQDQKEGAAEREKKQVQIMRRNNEKRLRDLARAGAKKGNEDQKGETAEEIVAYQSTKQYPDYVLPNQVKVDMVRECVILPICGNPIPFHISTIKNVVLPDPDTASYLRINFYTAGVTLGKDTPSNTVNLIQKYAPYATFIRELTFRSLESHSLTHVSG